jgi:formiminoglutamase
MDIGIYFEPVNVEELKSNVDLKIKRFGDSIKIYSELNAFPDLAGTDIAIIGVKEDRRAYKNEGCMLAPDYIRKYFYNLFPVNDKMKIADLGNIKRGFEIEDTYFAVKSVVAELIQNKIIPIIIGGSQDLTFANYQAYESLGQIINIVQVDSCFDLGESEEEDSSRSYLSKIITHQPNYLFNFTNLGYQSYFVDQDAVDLMKNLFFDTYRLGVVRADLEEAEPIVRNADMLTFDVSSIRQSDAPGNGNTTPNGFYGEEACQIVRYAGISDKLSSIGFYEINPRLDNKDQTSHLTAQMIWYFIEGFYSRKQDYPYKEKEEYIKYLVTIKEQKHEIVFYKSKKSDRWWMEVPCPVNLKVKYERHYLVPCSIKDYQIACKDDIPDRWWQVYQKLM